MNSYRTSDGQIAEIALREGYRAKAYKPLRDSNWTAGYGQEHALFPGTPGEIPVVEGLVIDRKTAWDALCFFIYNVVDPLVTQYCNPQSQAEHDACSSWIYNIRHTRLRKDEYTLPKLVRLADRSPEAMRNITDCWLQYCLTPGAESGLYRRRLVELLDFHGLPKSDAAMGYIMSARVARLDKGETLANVDYVHPNGKFAATVGPELVLGVAEHTKLTEDQITAYENEKQLARLRGDPEPAPPKPSAKPVAAKKPAPVSPAPSPAESPVDASLPPKKIEDSKTGKAVSRADRGKETTIIGTVTGTGVAAAAANAEKVGAVIEKFKPETFMLMGGALCLFLIVMGVLMWWSGRNEAYHRRLEQQDPKY